MTSAAASILIASANHRISFETDLIYFLFSFKKLKSANIFHTKRKAPRSQPALTHKHRQVGVLPPLGHVRVERLKCLHEAMCVQPRSDSMSRRIEGHDVRGHGQQQRVRARGGSSTVHATRHAINGAREEAVEMGSGGRNSESGGGERTLTRQGGNVLFEPARLVATEDVALEGRVQGDEGLAAQEGGGDGHVEVAVEGRGVAWREKEHTERWRRRAGAEIVCKEGDCSERGPLVDEGCVEGNGDVQKQDSGNGEAVHASLEAGEGQDGVRSSNEKDWERGLQEAELLVGHSAEDGKMEQGCKNNGVIAETDNAEQRQREDGEQSRGKSRGEVPEEGVCSVEGREAVENVGAKEVPWREDPRGIEGSVGGNGEK